MNHVVVTGVSGFIGSHLAEALLAEGRQVLGVDRRVPATDREAAGRLAGPLSHPRFSFLPGDLTRMPLEPLTDGADIVFHLAGQPGVRPSWQPDVFPGYTADNIVATHLVADACLRTGVRRLVVASSSSVYGGAGETPLHEDAPTYPASPYGVTKLAAERLALAHAARPESPTSVVALRYFTVYGPRQRGDMLIRRAVEAALGGPPLTVYGDGAQRRDFTYVGDAVAATVAAGRAPVTGGEVVNVGGGHRTVSVLDILATVERLTGRPVPVERWAPRAGDVRATLADATRATTLLGWRSATSLEEGIAAQLDWARGRPGRLAAPSSAATQTELETR